MSFPLAELVADQRARLSLSLAAVARAMADAADQEGTHCGASRQTIHEIERGRIPHPDALRWLAVALELPVAQVSAAAREQTMNRRQLLQGAAVAAGGFLMPDQVRPAKQVEDVVGYLRRVFPEFSTADWILGSQLVLPSIPRHLALVDQLLGETTGQARTELLTVGARWAEFAAWLYQDAGHARPAASWADRAMEWAEEAGNPVMVAYVLVRKANQAAERRDAARTVGLAQAAQRHRLPARVQAVALQQEAHGHALIGDETQSLRALDQSLTLAARGDEGPGRYCTPGYVEIQRATCWQELGQPGRAIPVLERELAGLPAVHHRDRGVYLARTAAAYTAIGERDHALAMVREARAVATATGSRRILRELRRTA
jgi:transcriptional regulator with XRE-family HTH domain